MSFSSVVRDENFCRLQLLLKTNFSLHSRSHDLLRKHKLALPLVLHTKLKMFLAAARIKNKNLEFLLSETHAHTDKECRIKRIAVHPKPHRMMRSLVSWNACTQRSSLMWVSSAKSHNSSQSHNFPQLVSHRKASLPQLVSQRKASLRWLEYGIALR